MKKLISCIIFIVITLVVINQFSYVLTPKSENRYFIMEKYLEANPEDTQHDVQVYGSCHSYTSFNPVYLEETTGVSSFVYGNAGEIIPTTYVRMVDQFKNHIPEVALVEIWGINPYETYSSHQRVFGFYLANNLERTKSLKAKQEVISDFSHMEYEDISFLSMNFPVMNYKDRLLDGSLTKVDVFYSFEGTRPYNSDYTYNEMTSRLLNNGYKVNPSVAIEDYPERQNYIKEGEFTEIEPDIVEYIQKIINFCKENDVELIFYRSPYTSTKNELRKLNHLQRICDDNNVQFVDLEAEIQFDYIYDFLDYQHLSEIGANKATAFLSGYIMDALGTETQLKTEETVYENMLTDNNFESAGRNSGGTAFNGEGDIVDGWRTNYDDDVISLTSEGLNITINDTQSGWHLYQSIENVSEFTGKSFTAYFDIEDHEGSQIKPIVSFRDKDDEELTATSVEIKDGKLLISCVAPGLVENIRIGFYAYEGASKGDFITVNEIELYPGAHTFDSLQEIRSK